MQKSKLVLCEGRGWKIFGRKRSAMKFCASQGFTLIEMIVSLAIFSVVAVVALGALMKIVSANKKAQSLQSAMTNINYALESMSREMRVGSDFSCQESGAQQATFPFTPAECTFVADSSTNPNLINGSMIAFRSSKLNGFGTCNLEYAYRFEKIANRWDIQKAAQSIVDITCEGTLGAGGVAFTSIIDPNVIITGYAVVVTDSNPTTAPNNPYPRATFRISGYVGARELERSYFNIQTTVSARVPSGQ